MGIWQILVVTGVLDPKKDAAADAKKPADKEKKAGDKASFDFSDFHSTSSGAINGMRASIPASFNAPLETAVEYIQSIGLLPYQNGVLPPNGGLYL